MQNNHHHHQHLKSNNISKLAVILLSLVLITGISLFSTLQVGAQGQVQQQQSPTRITPRPLSSNDTTQGLDAARAANQSAAVVVIPQGTMEMIKKDIQDALIAIHSLNKETGEIALNRLAQELNIDLPPLSNVD